MRVRYVTGVHSVFQLYLGWMYSKIGSADCGRDSIPYLFDQSADANFVHFTSQRLGFNNYDVILTFLGHDDAKVSKTEIRALEITPAHAPC